MERARIEATPILIVQSWPIGVGSGVFCNNIYIGGKYELGDHVMHS